MFDLMEAEEKRKFDEHLDEHRKLSIRDEMHEMRENQAVESRRLSIMSWEFMLAIIVNVIIAVYFITTSQATQDVTLASHEQRILQNERLVEKMIEEKVTVARLEQQIYDLKSDIQEIKQILREE